MQRLFCFMVILGSLSLHAFTPFLSFSASKSELIKLYSKHRILPVSGLRYAFDPESCSVDGYVSGLTKEPEKILWRYVVPESLMGKGMACMTQKVCLSSFSHRYIKGPICCRKISPAFKKMSADMHNIIPTVMQEGVENLWDAQKVVHKGNIARIYLYMQYQYKLDLDANLLDQLRHWDQLEPPTAWEKNLNKKIFELQGTFNPYIEKL